MPPLLLPLYAEHAFILCVAPSENRVCPGCRTVHALFVLRQRGGEIAHKCLVCDKASAEVA